MNLDSYPDSKKLQQSSGLVAHCPQNVKRAIPRAIPKRPFAVARIYEHDEPTDVLW